MVSSTHVSKEGYNFVINKFITDQTVNEAIIFGVFILINWLNTEESLVCAVYRGAGVLNSHEFKLVIELTIVLVKLESEIVSVHVSFKLVLLNRGTIH